MKEIFYKLVGIEPISPDNKEAICLLPVVALWVIMMAFAVLV